MTDFLPGLGDNLPPKEFAIGESITTYLKGIHHRLITRRDELIGAEARLPELPADKDSPDAERAVTEYARQISACSKTADTERVSAKEPYLDGGRRVDAFFKAIIEPLGTLSLRINTKLTAYKRGVEKRERDRLAAEAKAAEAAAVDDASLAKAIEAEELTKAPSTDLTRTRTQYGASSSLSHFADFKDVDRDQLSWGMLKEHFTDDAINSAIRSYLRANKKTIEDAVSKGQYRLCGITWFLNSKTNIR